eukprot:scpid43198/ scgid27017/ 
MVAHDNSIFLLCRKPLAMPYDLDIVEVPQCKVDYLLEDIQARFTKSIPQSSRHRIGYIHGRRTNDTTGHCHGEAERQTGTYNTSSWHPAEFGQDMCDSECHNYLQCILVVHSENFPIRHHLANEKSSLVSCMGEQNRFNSLSVRKAQRLHQ